MKDLPDGRIKILAVVGSTAVGKTVVSQLLAERLNGELVSADSMQVYRGMDIGTAKPSKTERKKYRYHLIDIVDLLENYSAAEYQKHAREVFIEIASRSHLPILVGGSGLYVRAALDDLVFPAGTIDSTNRRQLELELKKDGPDALYTRLKQVDPEAAKRIHPGNIRRIIRALEVDQEGVTRFSDLQQNWPSIRSIFEVAMFGLLLERNLLYKKIDERVDQMMAKGLLKEVKDLVAKGLSESSTSAQALGYKEIIAHLKGELSLDEAVDLIKKRTRHFAKRQSTWFRQDPRVHWIDLSEKSYFQAASEIVKLWNTNGRKCRSKNG